ncbi:MAG: hypothetical protein ACHP7N_00325 [Caulobacterales bacterium]
MDERSPDQSSGVVEFRRWPRGLDFPVHPLARARLREHPEQLEEGVRLIHQLHLDQGFLARHSIMAISAKLRDLISEDRVRELLAQPAE